LSDHPEKKNKKMNDSKIFPALVRDHVVSYTDAPSLLSLAAVSKEWKSAVKCRWAQLSRSEQTDLQHLIFYCSYGPSSKRKSAGFYHQQCSYNFTSLYSDLRWFHSFSAHLYSERQQISRRYLLGFMLNMAENGDLAYLRVAFNLPEFAWYTKKHFVKGSEANWSSSLRITIHAQKMTADTLLFLMDKFEWSPEQLLNDVDFLGSDGKTLLWTAIANNRLEVVRMLVDQFKWDVTKDLYCSSVDVNHLDILNTIIPSREMRLLIESRFPSIRITPRIFSE